MVQPKNRRIATEAYVDSAVAPSVIPELSNLDDFRTQEQDGPWIATHVPTIEGFTGDKPFGDYPFALDVIFINQAAWQIAFPGGAGTYTEAKIRKYSPLAPTGWTSWQPLSWSSGYITNLDTAKNIGTRAYDSNSVGAPTADAGNVTVLPGLPDASSRTQVAITRDTSPRTFTRTTALSGWNAWKETGAAPESAVSAPLGARREMLLQRSRVRHGGKRGTSGKAVVTLSFDHGFVKFRDLIMPELIRLGLPATLAVNPGTLNVPGESEGVTYADLQSWAIQYGFELANHSVSHGDATTPEAMEAAIVGALDTIRANTPLLTTDAYIMPGVSGTGYDGFDAGVPYENWWNHPAGRLILDNHAVVSSLTGGYIVPLDGQPNQTMTRHGVDLDSWAAAAETRIQEAERRGAGIHIYTHPNLVNLESRVTLTRLIQMYEFIAAERDAGRLEVLTMSGMGWAAADSSGAFDLADSTNWATGSQTIELAQNFAWARGSQWELSAGGAGEVALTVTDNTGVLNRTVTVTPGVARARLPFTIPANATTLTVTATGGELPAVLPV